MKNWKDVYELPLEDKFIDKNLDWRSSRIIDAKRNFVFQFHNVTNETQIKILDVINGVLKLDVENIKFFHRDGIILFNNERKVLMIRGWGNLTGTGGHNLSHEEAANVQDTFADYIVEKLNER